MVNGKNYLKTGTTIVGICCRDGVVLGADTRCTGGPLIIDKNKLRFTLLHLGYSTAQLELQRNVIRSLDRLRNIWHCYELRKKLQGT